ncbi:hypothetical protein FNV43_RR10053 [Rhamnella rubrinervis]|uniref:TIR domain-containing protein n=1 Tax=Rhamnella rubrinervis TaxID=2594499 RepID=A0A8K0HCE7_9ROSA|nr:hypothetical protein FNV43_RR10053 [Rhamnella rubrinervis]
MSRFVALSNMDDLRLFKILGSFAFQAETGSSASTLDSLSNDLKFLEWNRFLSKNFQRVLNHMDFLEKLPPSMKGLNSLECLNLYGCRKPCQIPEGIGDLRNLKELDVRESGMDPALSKIKDYDVFSSCRDKSHAFMDHLRSALSHEECRPTSGLVVVPIFYHVNPSDVRNLGGSFRDAFRNHENDRELGSGEV